MKSGNNYPHFLCIGVQKSGTSWLYRNLRWHPEIFLSHVKELNYFTTRNLNFKRRRKNRSWKVVSRHHLPRGILKGELGLTLWNLRYLLYRRSDAWYESLFEQGRGRILGDISPGYAVLTDREIAHVASIMPDTKIVILLRNPVERAWSHARMDWRYGYGYLSYCSDWPIEDITLDDWQKHFDAYYPTIQGDYPRLLEKWHRHFPADQIFVGYLDEIQQQGLDFLNRLAEFVGASPQPVNEWKSAMQRVNAQASDEMPPEVERYLCSKFSGYLEDLIKGPYLQDTSIPESWFRDVRDRLNR